MDHHPSEEDHRAARLSGKHVRGRMFRQRSAIKPAILPSSNCSRERGPGQMPHGCDDSPSRNPPTHRSRFLPAGATRVTSTKQCSVMQDFCDRIGRPLSQSDELWIGWNLGSTRWSPHMCGTGPFLSCSTQDHDRQRFGFTREFHRMSAFGAGAAHLFHLPRHKIGQTADVCCLCIAVACVDPTLTLTGLLHEHVRYSARWPLPQNQRLLSAGAGNRPMLCLQL